MVTNRDSKLNLKFEELLQEVDARARSLIKHLPCRSEIRIFDTSSIDTESKSAFGIRIRYTQRKITKDYTLVFDQKQLKEKLFAKKIVENFLKQLPVYEIEVENIKEAVLEFLKNFSTLDKDNIKDSFRISKLPYRQLLINNDIFIKVCNKSYQRLLCKTDLIKDWKEKDTNYFVTTVSFNDFIQKSLKRKEIITMLLLLCTY